MFEDLAELTLLPPSASLLIGILFSPEDGDSIFF
jgi:hypothetical protein